MADEDKRIVSARVAERVKALRKERGITTHQKLADALKAQGWPTDRSTVVRLESGKRGISVDDLVALAAALNVSPGWLLVPTETGDEEVRIVGSVAAPGWAAWQWVDGLHPLPSHGEEEGYNTPVEQDDFERGRPVELRQREQHPAVRAVRHLGFAVRRVVLYQNEDTLPRRIRVARDALARVAAELDALEAGIEEDRRV